MEAKLTELLRTAWHGLFLDGRNEHGTHVVSLPQQSFDFAGDSIEGDPETIFAEAEALGHAACHAVVAEYCHCTDEGFFSHWEFVRISPELTAALYGTAAEQAVEIARASLPEEPR